MSLDVRKLLIYSTLFSNITIINLREILKLVSALKLIFDLVSGLPLLCTQSHGLYLIIKVVKNV
jgi:hypothetical protein